MYMRCKKCKELYPKGPLMYYYEDINENATITIHHILSLLFYCNYDNLSAKFSSTFRKIRANERWNSVKKRNQEYEK